MSDIVTFGELLLRLSTPGKTRFNQAVNFDVAFGGAEANVAVSLANFGLNSFFVTLLPENEIAEAAIQALRKFGVKTDFIYRSGGRMGIYFLENGASQRTSKVIYDRADSAINYINNDLVNWDEVFRGKSWFHWSGITPALSEKAAESIENACIAAKNLGLAVSCDLNYRSKLWNEKEAQSVMIPLMKYVDICIANEEHVKKCLNFESTIPIKSNDRLKRAKSIARELKGHFDFQAVVMTLRETFSVNRGAWSAVLHDNKDCKDPIRSTRYEIDAVDRVGAGDAFAAGLIYGLLAKENTVDALEFAAAACCLKHSIPGDFNLVSIEEIETLLRNKGQYFLER